ncbi:MAG: hypothetical protein ACREMY_21770, partial [bacterium]
MFQLEADVEMVLDSRLTAPGDDDDVLHAERLGIQIEIGMRSICPTSTMFDAKAGTAEEQLTRMLHAAGVVGSPIVRCVLGSMADRQPPALIAGHIRDTVG